MKMAFESRVGRRAFFVAMKWAVCQAMRPEKSLLTPPLNSHGRGSSRTGIKHRFSTKIPLNLGLYLIRACGIWWIEIAGNVCARVFAFEPLRAFSNDRFSVYAEITFLDLLENLVKLELTTETSICLVLFDTICRNHRKKAPMSAVGPPTLDFNMVIAVSTLHDPRPV